MIVSLKQLAEAAGMKPPSVLGFEKRGTIKRVGKGQYDLDSCLRAMGKPLPVREGRQEGSQSSGFPPLASSNAALMAFRAKRERIELERLQGRLLDVEDVKRTWERHCSAIKNRLLLLEAKVPLESRSIVAREVCAALNELADGA